MRVLRPSQPRVRVVTNDEGLIVCQVCVAKCADIFDAEVGLEGPEGGWTTTLAAQGLWSLMLTCMRIRTDKPGAGDNRLPP